MNHQFLKSSMLAVSLAALAACGGGGSTPTAEKTTGDVTLSGTAAIGAAMANATIKVKCATGEKSTTADSKGIYAVTLTEASLPCVIEATDGTNTLHSLAEGTGPGKKTANITPLTEYVLAQVMGSEKTDEIFKSFNSESQGKITSSKVADAVTAIKASFKDVLTIDFDPLVVEFKAAANGEAGDATDKVLDKLFSLAQQASPDANPKDALKALTKKVVEAGSGSSGSPAPLALAKLPVENCPAVRNVPYRIIGLDGRYGITSKEPYSDKSSTTWNDESTSKASGPLTFDKDIACKFESAWDDGSKDSGAFASSGVLVLGGHGNLIFGFPEQKIPTAELAGPWNALQYQKDGSNWINKQYIFTVDASGNMTSGQDCSGATQASDTCSALAANQGPKAMVVNDKGGFDQLNQSGEKIGNRLFAYRNASGELMMVSTGSNAGSAGAGMLIATKQRKLTLPKVNDVAKIWDIQASVSNSTLVSTFNTSQYTVKSSDATQNTATRVRDTVDGTADGRQDTVAYNQPREGLRYRAAGSYTPAGSTISKDFGAAVQMPIKDMGLTVTTGTGSSNTGKFLNLSVVMP